MKNFFESTQEILIIIATILWQVFIGLLGLIFRLISKFCKDVLKSIYGKVVAITAGLLLLAVLTQLITAP